MNDTPVFLTGSLMRHVITMSLTASVGILAIFAVDFVDMMFISMLGNEQLAAAVGYAGTLLFFTNAINVGLSIAAGSLVSRHLGAGAVGAARKGATAVAMVTVGISILVPLILVPNLRWVLQHLGASGQTLLYARDYCAIILPTMSFMGMAMVTMAVLRAHGMARDSMMVTLLGGIVNATLDPILIFAVGLDLDGAAYASIIARFTMMTSGVWWVITRCQGFTRPSLAILKGQFHAMTAIAVPAVLTNLATPVGNAIVTREMARFGTDAVAAMAVIGRLTPMVFAVVLALSGAIGPIIGQNYGANKPDRMRMAFLDGLKFVAAYVLLMTAVLFLLRAPIANMFNAEGDMRGLIYLFCGPLALLQFFNGAIYVCNASFNNMGVPVYSTMLNWGRNTLGVWPLVIVGATYAGAYGVLIGQAVGGIIFGLVGIFVAGRRMHICDADAKPDAFSGSRSLHQVTSHRSW